MSVLSRLRGAPLVAALLLMAVPAPAPAVEVEVRVEGIDGSAHENVRESLSILRYSELPDLTDTMIQRLHARAPDEVRRALRPFGHYQPEVDGTLQFDGTRWRARYRVTLDEPVRIRNVDIRISGPGAEEPEFTAPADRPQPGQRLHHPTYDAVKQHLRTVASNRGYLDAHFTASELRVSATERVADIVLHFETGERYRFGDIALEQDVLSDDFVRRFVHFSEGEPFSVGSLLALQFALTDSEYFRLVEVDAAQDDAVDLAIPVTVRMEARERHRYTAGIGYATDTGARGLLGYENRRVNQRGHRWRTDIEIAQIRNIASTSYVIPLEDPVWDRFTLSAGLRQEELGDVDLDTAELITAHTMRDGRWQRTISGRLSREREQVGGTSALITQFVPSVEWLYTGGDSGMRAQRGLRGTFSIAASGSFLGSPTDFVQLRTRLRWITPVGGLDRIILRTDLGYTAAGNPHLLPASQRFFAGGDRSVRGYRYQSLGPTDADGNVIGGRYIATFGAEYEHWFTERWGVGVFADTGNAFMSRDEQLFTGAGIGLRIGFPFALIALDLAHPFDDEGGRMVRLHLTLGADP